MECVTKGRQYLITAPEWVMVPLLGHSGVSTVMRSQHPLTYSPAQGVGGTPRGVSLLRWNCHYHANFMFGRLPEVIKRIRNERLSLFSFFFLASILKLEFTMQELSTTPFVEIFKGYIEKFILKA